VSPWMWHAATMLGGMTHLAPVNAGLAISSTTRLRAVTQPAEVSAITATLETRHC